MPVSNPVLLRNIRLLYAVNFLSGCYFIDAIYTLFGVKFLHLRFFRTGSLFFVAWFVSIAADFAGGVIADRYGRKHTQLLGLSLQIISFVPYLLTRSYPLLLAFRLVEGLGIALSLNTLHALVYEQACENDQEGVYDRVNASAQVWLFSGLAISSVVGGLAYRLDPRLPYALLIVALAAALGLSAAIKTSSRAERLAAQAALPPTRIMRTAFNTLRTSRQLRLIVVLSCLIGIFGDMLFGYYQPFYIQLGLNAVALGVIFAGIRIISALGSIAMQYLPRYFSAVTIQALISAAIAMTASLLLVLHAPWLYVVPAVMAFASGFIEPNLRLAIQKRAQDSSRTAALSAGTTLMNIGIGIGYVAAYTMADHVRPHLALEIILVGAIGTLLVALAGRTVQS